MKPDPQQQTQDPDQKAVNLTLSMWYDSVLLKYAMHMFFSCNGYKVWGLVQQLKNIYQF